jgi:hypothetical protein
VVAYIAQQAKIMMLVLKNVEFAILALNSIFLYIDAYEQRNSIKIDYKFIGFYYLNNFLFSILFETI